MSQGSRGWWPWVLLVFGLAMMLVLGFYFAAPHMGDIAKSALLMFGKRKKDETGD